MINIFDHSEKIYNYFVQKTKIDKESSKILL